MQLDFERDIIEIRSQIERLLDLADRRGVDVSSEITELRTKLEARKECARGSASVNGPSMMSGVSVR